MLSHRNDFGRGEGVLNDNGRFSGAWNNASPSNIGILAVASEHLGSIYLHYIADGALIVSAAFVEGRYGSSLRKGQSRDPSSIRIKRQA